MKHLGNEKGGIVALSDIFRCPVHSYPVVLALVETYSFGLKCGPDTVSVNTAKD